MSTNTGRQNSFDLDSMSLPGDETRVAGNRRRGRGSATNRSGRFEAYARAIFDDGWTPLEELPPFKTEVTVERPKTIITRNASPDLSFDRSINPYRGCEHGCAYCYARPTHAYQGLSPGLDFETKLFAKPDAAALLEKELSAPNYVPKTIAMGTNTDPYQPIEREYRLTRQVLEVMECYGHPVGIVTKSALITRDIDILSRMAERGLAKVAISVTTLDRKLAQAMEPRASTPQRRLGALMRLAEAGVPTAVMVAPIVPGLTDSELESILAAASAAGVQEAGYILLRLPLEVRELFVEWLQEAYPDRAARVVSLIKQIRDGKAYDSTWGRRQRGTGPVAWAIGRRFEIAAEKNGLNKQSLKLRTDLFEPSARPGQQLQLL